MAGTEARRRDQWRGLGSWSTFDRGRHNARLRKGQQRGAAGLAGISASDVVREAETNPLLEDLGGGVFRVTQPK